MLDTHGAGGACTRVQALKEAQEYADETQTRLDAIHEQIRQEREAHDAAPGDAPWGAFPTWYDWDHHWTAVRTQARIRAETAARSAGRKST